MSSRTGSVPSSTSSSIPSGTEGSATRSSPTVFITSSSGISGTSSGISGTSSTASNGSRSVSTTTVFGDSSRTTQVVFRPSSPTVSGGNANSSSSANGGMSSGLLLAIIIGSLILFPVLLLYLYRSVCLLRRSKNLKKEMNQETFSGIASTVNSNGPSSKNRISLLAVRTMAASIAESAASEDDIFVRSVSPAPFEGAALSQQNNNNNLRRNSSLPSFGYAPRYHPLNRGNSIVSGSDAYHQVDSSINASSETNASYTNRLSQNIDGMVNARYQHSARYPALHCHSSAYTQEYQLANHPNQVYTHFLATASQSNSSNSNSTNGDSCTASASSGTPLLGPIQNSQKNNHVPVVVAVNEDVILRGEERSRVLQQSVPLSRSPSPLSLHDSEQSKHPSDT